MIKVKFKTRDGVQMEGYLIRQYRAFEGDMRYIIQTDNGEYRCIKQDGELIELVV